MTRAHLPENLARLHRGEEFLRSRAMDALADDRLRLHAEMIEQAMNMADGLRQFETEDEDLKLIQVLGMRTFNAFGAAVKLCLSGYYQNAALILRDVLETAFLMDLFRGDRRLIAGWRLADKASRLRDFKPVRVRTLLDERDGFTERKRAAMYDMFSELAGHPTMQSVAMLRPRGMDAQIGPFFDVTALEALISEMGRLAVQVGEQLDAFLPAATGKALFLRQGFDTVKRQWIARFYGDHVSSAKL
jgi:hypothetical protein